MNVNIETTGIYFKNLEAKTRYVFNEGGTRCFHSDQLVITNKGDKKISEIQAGDFVLTYNEGTKQNEYKKVNETLTFENNKRTLRITLKNGQTIICTEDHKFYYKGGWHSLKYLLSLKKKIMKKWKSIPGFSRYEASTDGKLRSLNYKRSGKVKELKPALTPDGYFQTMLQDDKGKYHSYKVHRFVTLAFYGAKPEGLEVNHKDGIKTNNNIDNLEYCTRSQNMIHSFANGLEKPLRGSLNAMAKLTENDVMEIRKFVRDSKSRFYGRDALAAKYGISSAHIKDIVSGRRGIWNCVPMI